MNMNNFQQMLNQAKLAQKKHENFKKEVFHFSKNQDLIKISISGNYKITLNIDFKKLLTELDDDYDMLNDILQVALNEALTEVKKEERKIIGVI